MAKPPVSILACHGWDDHLVHQNVQDFPQVATEAHDGTVQKCGREREGANVVMTDKTSAEVEASKKAIDLIMPILKIGKYLDAEKFLIDWNSRSVREAKREAWTESCRFHESHYCGCKNPYSKEPTE